MPEAYEDEIRARAYKLWEDAGKPDFGLDDFWLEAEQQIRKERLANETRTPDNL